jgi:hypothetical protein
MTRLDGNRDKKSARLCLMLFVFLHLVCRFTAHVAKIGVDLSALMAELRVSERHYGVKFICGHFEFIGGR